MTASHDSLKNYFTNMSKSFSASEVFVRKYNHGVSAVVNAYEGGGVYSPTQNRIYLVPYAQSNKPTWHYIDCNNGNVVAYNHGSSAAGGTYYGGFYSPTQDRVYLVPYVQTNKATCHYIDRATGVFPSISIMSGPLFNKF